MVYRFWGNKKKPKQNVRKRQGWLRLLFVALESLQNHQEYKGWDSCSSTKIRQFYDLVVIRGEENRQFYDLVVRLGAA